MFVVRETTGPVDRVDGRFVYITHRGVTHILNTDAPSFDGGFIADGVPCVSRNGVRAVMWQHLTHRVFRVALRGRSVYVKASV